jgi:hypothetical protein
MQIGVEDELLLVALLGILLAKPDHGAQRLHIEAVGLGFGINVADIVGNCLLFLL